MDQDSETGEGNSIGDLENEEFTTPTSSLGTQRKDNSWAVTVLAALILVVLLIGIGWYIYTGMQNTPAVTTDEAATTEMVEEEVVKEELSQDTIDLMNAMQRESGGATAEELEKMKSMQGDSKDGTPTDEGLQRIKDMNPETAIPVF